MTIMNKKMNNKGFSLVELIVVVLILGILAVAVTPSVMKYVATARANVDEMNMGTYKSAIRVALLEENSAEKGYYVFIVDAETKTLSKYDATGTDASGKIVTTTDEYARIAEEIKAGISDWAGPENAPSGADAEEDFAFILHFDTEGTSSVTTLTDIVITYGDDDSIEEGLKDAGLEEAIDE